VKVHIETHYINNILEVDTVRQKNNCTRIYYTWTAFVSQPDFS